MICKHPELLPCGMQAAVEKINRYLSSPLSVVILAGLTAAAFALSMEMAFYCFVIVYAIYVALFAHDFSPLMPLFVFCYIAPSAANNPGMHEQSVFSGARGIFLICFVAIPVLLLFFRMAVDQRIGVRKLFCMQRKQLTGLLLLGGAFLLSGIGSRDYTSLWQRNLVFAALQLLAFLLLYFVFTATVDWERFNPAYFAAIGIGMGFVVTIELLIVYMQNEYLGTAMIYRENIYTGWGVSNNLGSMIAMSIPFAMYFSARGKHATLWFSSSLILLAAVFMTGSRSAMLVAVPVYLVCLVITCKSAQNPIGFRRIILVALALLAVLTVIFRKEIPTIFEQVPGIVESIDGQLVLNDSHRLEIYKNGLLAFSRSILFGESFFPQDYLLYDFSTVEAFSGFFPPRWHNTVIQLLASCGLVGFAAYLFHRYQTLRLFLERRRSGTCAHNDYIALSAAALLLTSLLDCHLFNVGPALFYSMMLAVIECSKETAEPDPLFSATGVLKTIRALPFWTTKTEEDEP